MMSERQKYLYDFTLLDTRGANGGNLFHSILVLHVPTAIEYRDHVQSLKYKKNNFKQRSITLLYFFALRSKNW